MLRFVPRRDFRSLVHRTTPYASQTESPGSCVSDERDWHRGSSAVPMIGLSLMALCGFSLGAVACAKG